MGTTTHTTIPAEGLDVHVSAADAQAQGVAPGEPAVVEVTVRPYGAEDWIKDGQGRVFVSDEEEDAFFDRCPESGA